MVQHQQKAEESGAPEKQAFNLDALSDQEIQVLGRVLIASVEHDSADESGNFRARDPLFSVEEGRSRARLLTLMTDGLAELFKRDPRRGKRLLGAMVLSDQDYDRYVAAVTAPKIAAADFDFAADVLVGVNNTAYGISLDARIDATSEIAYYVCPERGDELRRRLDQFDDPNRPYIPDSLVRAYQT